MLYHGRRLRVHLRGIVVFARHARFLTLDGKSHQDCWGVGSCFEAMAVAIRRDECVAIIFDVENSS